jgi:hypothetical protein
MNMYSRAKGMHIMHVINKKRPCFEVGWLNHRAVNQWDGG